MLADWTMVLVGAMPNIPADTTLKTSGDKSATASIELNIDCRKKNNTQTGIQIFVLCGNMGAAVKCQGRVAFNLAGIESNEALR